MIRYKYSTLWLTHRWTHSFIKKGQICCLSIDRQGQAGGINFVFTTHQTRLCTIHDVCVHHNLNKIQPEFPTAIYNKLSLQTFNLFGLPIYLMLVLWWGKCFRNIPMVVLDFPIIRFYCFVALQWQRQTGKLVPGLKRSNFSSCLFREGFRHFISSLKERCDVGIALPLPLQQCIGIYYKCLSFSKNIKIRCRNTY